MFRVVGQLPNLGLLAALVCFFICTASKAGTSTVSLSWNASTGSGIAGYNIYYGGASGDYTNMVSVGDSTTAAISGLIAGDTYYFAATAYDDYGDESGFSNEISYLVPGTLKIVPGSSSGNFMQIKFPVVPGKQYELQASEDLTSWSNIWQSTSTSNAWIELDDPVTGQPQRFYRVVSN